MDLVDFFFRWRGTLSNFTFIIRLLWRFIFIACSNLLKLQTLFSRNGIFRLRLLFNAGHSYTLSDIYSSNSYQWCRVPKCHTGTLDQMSRIRKFWPRESIFLRNFAPMVAKVSLQEFLHVLADLWPKILIRYVNPKIGKKSRRETLRRTGAEFRSATPTPSKIQTFWHLERVFFFETLHQWCRKFLSSIFYQFWPLYDRKFRFGTFDQGATISLLWYFRPMVRLMGD